MNHGPSLAIAMSLALTGALRPAPAHAGPEEQALANKFACMSCHSQTEKLVGPSFDAIAAKYGGDNPKAVDALIAVIQKGGSGVWGPVPMPANPQISEADARTAHFSDRGRWFQRDRGRCFKVIVDDHGSTRVKGFMVSQSSMILVKRRALSTPASIAGVVNAAPKAVWIGLSTAQACPRRRASLATNDRRGGQAVFGATAVALHELREAVMASPAFCASTRP